MPRPSACRLPALALAISLAASPPLAAQTPEAEATVTWLPSSPTVEDVVVLNVSGIWRDSCTPQLVAVHRNPSPDEFPALYVDPGVPLPLAAAWAVVLEPRDGGCLSAAMPYSLHLALGHLPAGHNRVLVIVRDTAVEPEREIFLDRVEFLVSGDTDTLLLDDGRFRATVTWGDFQGNTGHGQVVPGASDTSGLFSFFTPDNWELLVKVLDGCTVNGRFWVFVAAATSVEYTLRIEDLDTGEEWVRSNPLGELSPAYADTAAFATCALP